MFRWWDLLFTRGSELPTSAGEDLDPDPGGSGSFGDFCQFPADPDPQGPDPDPYPRIRIRIPFTSVSIHNSHNFSICPWTCPNFLIQVARHELKLHYWRQTRYFFAVSLFFLGKICVWLMPHFVFVQVGSGSHRIRIQIRPRIRPLDFARIRIRIRIRLLPDPPQHYFRLGEAAASKS